MIYNISASPMFNKDNWLPQIDFFFHLENNKGFQFKIQEALKRNISLIQWYHQIREILVFNQILSKIQINKVYVKIYIIHTFIPLLNNLRVFQTQKP